MGGKERNVTIPGITPDAEADALPMAVIIQEGHAFDWLTDEPDLYTDADLVPSQAG